MNREEFENLPLTEQQRLAAKATQGISQWATEHIPAPTGYGLFKNKRDGELARLVERGNVQRAGRMVGRYVLESLERGVTIEVWTPEKFKAEWEEVPTDEPDKD